MGKKENSKVESRGEWGHPAEFVLSCLGYAVGLGNVWRFPYLTYENGGGAFLIPYAIMLIFVGLPIFFIELIAGQYSSSGPMTVYSVAPLFQGVGAGMILISCISNIYYNMIIAWSLYYMFASWQAVLPWTYCNNDFNTAYCYTIRESEGCEDGNGTWFNQTCYNWTETSESERLWLENVTKQRTTPSEEYYKRSVLDLSDRIEDTEYVKWDLCLCLLLAWILNYICVIKGIKSSGKAVYFTATFPYIILVILLVRGCLLPGARKGIDFYIIPKWEKLGTAKVWVDAAGQIFFSLSVGLGGLMTFASYNKFHNNVWRDTLIVTFGNCLTSFFAGFAIFSTLGYLAVSVGREVEDVAQGGSGLAFIAYPEVVTWLEPPQLWSTLFFLMLFTLGLDSQFAGIENVMTAVIDMFPKLRKHKPWVSLVLCVIFFLLGLPCTTRAGLYWTDMMGYYSTGWSLVLIAFCECCVFAWVYGSRNLLYNLEEMLGYRFNKVHWWWWWLCWSVFGPGLIIVILVFNIIDFTPLSFGDYVIPEWAQALGWLMAVASVAMIPVFAVINIWKSYKDPDYQHLGCAQRFKKLIQPTKDWGPSGEPDVINGEIAMTSGNADVSRDTPDYYKGESNPAYHGSFEEAMKNDYFTRL